MRKYLVCVAIETTEPGGDNLEETLNEKEERHPYDDAYILECIATVCQGSGAIITGMTVVNTGDSLESKVYPKK